MHLDMTSARFDPDRGGYVHEVTGQFLPREQVEDRESSYNRLCRKVNGHFGGWADLAPLARAVKTLIQWDAGARTELEGALLLQVMPERDDTGLYELEDRLIFQWAVHATGWDPDTASFTGEVAHVVYP